MFKNSKKLKYYIKFTTTTVITTKSKINTHLKLLLCFKSIEAFYSIEAQIPKIKQNKSEILKWET